MVLRTSCMCVGCFSAGAEAGDGRDESNRSLQERLDDAKVQQTAADAEFQRAELAVKHLTKQLAEQRKAAAAKEKAGAGLAKEAAALKAKVDECSARLQVRQGRVDGHEGARMATGFGSVSWE